MSTLHGELTRLRRAWRILLEHVQRDLVRNKRVLCARLLWARWPGPLHHVPRLVPALGPWLMEQATGRKGARIDQVAL